MCSGSGIIYLSWALCALLIIIIVVFVVAFALDALVVASLKPWYRTLILCIRKIVYCRSLLYPLVLLVQVVCLGRGVYWHTIPSCTRPQTVHHWHLTSHAHLAFHQATIVLEVRERRVPSLIIHFDFFFKCMERVVLDFLLKPISWEVRYHPPSFMAPTAYLVCWFSMSHLPKWRRKGN